MGKTYRRDTDDAEYYKSQRLQRDQAKRRKKTRSRTEFDRDDKGPDRRFETEYNRR